MSSCEPQPIHPGEHLAEFLEELDITQYRLAKTIGVPQVRISDIVHCRRGITADTALRIARALGTTPEFWLNLQRMYDLDNARATTNLDDIVPPRRGVSVSHWNHRDARAVNAPWSCAACSAQLLSVSLSSEHSD